MIQSPITCNLGSTTIIINDKPHKCNHCPRSFDKKSSLRIHLRTHFGRKLFYCNICTKEFGWKNNYTEHINSHTGERPFICNVCNRRYMKFRYAKDHVKFHLFRKPFKCRQCTKGYFRMHDLNRHVRFVHKFKTRIFRTICDGPALTHCKKFYQCKICRRQFSSILNRNAHQCKKEDIKPLCISIE